MKPVLTQTLAYRDDVFRFITKPNLLYQASSRFNLYFLNGLLNEEVEVIFDVNEMEIQVSSCMSSLSRFSFRKYNDSLYNFWTFQISGNRFDLTCNGEAAFNISCYKLYTKLVAYRIETTNIISKVNIPGTVLDS